MIELRNVSVSFNGIPILEDISLEIKKGEFVFLVGQTGVGKSTLLRLLYMDLFPASGTVAVGEYESSKIRKREIPHLRRQIGVVFQDFKLFEDRNVFENVAFALYVTDVKRREIRDRVLQTLDDVGLTHKASDMPHQLSGGEQQRVAIARALVHDPFVILADEPTGNLDPGTAYELLELLKKINSRGTAILMATHNYELVKRFPARIVQIKNGKLLEVELNV
jgi:cell division transport system ATP-binding protein